MLWVKAFHIVFMTSWLSGLFYLPRIFVNLALATEHAERERLLTMSRKLYRFMLPLMVLTLGLGLALWLHYGIGRGAGWMHAKLALVVLLIGYHHACGRLLARFERDESKRSHVWLRWFNEVPVLLLAGIAVLVVVKPF